jgi:hypothetical protein
MRARIGIREREQTLEEREVEILKEGSPIRKALRQALSKCIVRASASAPSSWRDRAG